MMFKVWILQQQRLIAAEQAGGQQKQISLPCSLMTTSIGYTLSPVSLQSFTTPAGQSKVVKIASSNKNEEHTVIDSEVVISESKNGGMSFSTPRVITTDPGDGNAYHLKLRQHRVEKYTCVM